MYRLTFTARSDLRAIRAYLAPATAQQRNKVIDRLIATFEQANRYPGSGRLEPELIEPDQSVRSLLCYPYRIFYFENSEPLQIFAILHGKRNPAWLLQNR